MGFKWFRGQLESGEKETKHIQCAMGGKSTRFSVLKKAFPTAHIESANSPPDAWEYCGKEDTRVEGPVQFGIPPARRNTKGDVARFNRQALDEGPEKLVLDGSIHLKDYARIKSAIDLYRAVTVQL